MIDYYEILGVSSTASLSDIRQAYCRLALKWHPDKNLTNETEATKKFTEVCNAYEILGDSTKRLHYDSARPDFFDPFGFGITPMKRSRSSDVEPEATSLSSYQFKEPEQVFKECFKDDFDLDFGSFGGSFSCPTSTPSITFVTTVKSELSIHRGRSISRRRRRNISKRRCSISTNAECSINANREHNSSSRLECSFTSHNVPSRTESAVITSRTITTSITTTTSITISNGRRVEKKTKVKKCVEVKEVMKNGEVVSRNARELGDEFDNGKDKKRFSIPKFLRLNWSKWPTYSRL